MTEELVGDLALC